MEIKNQSVRYIFFTALLLLIPFSFLQAQTVKYFLEWQEDQKARRYEVVIEKEDGKEYRQTLREFTETSSIEVSLEPGKYRYMVIPYSFLDRPGEIPVWKEFDALTVLTPELYDFSPSVFYVDADTVHELAVTAKNLNSETRIYLRHIGGAIIVPDDKKIIVPVEHEIYKDGSIRLFFHNSQLIPGDYEIVARNPGGKETIKKDFTIASLRSEENPQDVTKKWFHILNYVCLGLGVNWANMGMYWGQDSPADQASLLPGFMAYFDFAFSQSGSLNIRFQPVSVSYYPSGSGDYTVMVDVFRFLIQMRLPNQSSAFCFRLGMLGFQNNLDIVSVYSSLGISFRHLFLKHWMLEFGFDNIHYFATDGGINGANLLHPLFRPFIGMGWQF